MLICMEVYESVSIMIWLHISRKYSTPSYDLFNKNTIATQGNYDATRLLSDTTDNKVLAFIDL